MRFQRAHRLMLALVVLAAFGCAAPTPTPARSDKPTAPPGGGSIVFGMAFSKEAFKITAPSATFPRAYAGIVWFVASLGEAPGAPSLTVIVARRTGATDTVVWTHPTPIADPLVPRLADGRSLAELGALQPGTYVMRIMDGTKVLAEGRFDVE